MLFDPCETFFCIVCEEMRRYDTAIVTSGEEMPQARSLVHHLNYES